MAALSGGAAVGRAVPPNAPITTQFRYHILEVPDAKTGALKTFRLAAATSPPWLYGAAQQDYTPEMLCWDMLLAGDGGAPVMAPLCGFDVAQYEAALEEHAVKTAFATGIIKTFKYHTHFVEDPKVGTKKFFVAAITALPRMLGSPDQHYTPEMLRWDELLLEQGGTPADTMAARCDISIDELHAAAAEALEHAPDALFKHHVLEVPDAKVGMKTFFLAAMTSTPDHYGRPEQHYTPEMLHWDCLRRDNAGLRDGLQSMAELCGENFDSFK
jgi:hypothetical protein